MKCPVCDQENSTMLCTRCGFDASTDCTMHPTLGPVGSLPSISARRKQWLDSQNKSVSSPACPQLVDYQKKVSDAATADEQDHQSHESHLLRSLQTANEQIAALMRDKREDQKRIETLQTELKTLTHWVYPENQTLKEKIQTLEEENQTLEEENQTLKGKIQTLEEKNQILSKANNALIKESIQMEDNVHDLVTQLSNADRRYQDAREYISSLEERNKVLKSNLEQSEDYRIASSQRYGEEALEVMKKTKEITEKDKEIAELESKLLAAEQRAAELEAERSKGIIARIFNR